MRTKKLDIFFLVIFIFSQFLISNLFSSSSTELFEDSWEKIKLFEKKGLPQSASSVVDSIYTEAKRNKNDSQVIKALLYKLKYIQQIDEFADVKIIKSLEEEINQTSFPAKAILHSILGEFYSTYYNQNKYTIMDRVKSNESDMDIEFWTEKDFRKKIIHHLSASLEESKKLQKIKIHEFDDILIKSEGERFFRPTLYDFLCFRVIDILSVANYHVAENIMVYTFNNKVYLSELKDFVDFTIPNNDSLSSTFLVIKTYQKLLKFRKNDKAVSPLIDADLKRLNYVYQRTNIKNKDILMENTLLSYLERFEKNPMYVDVAYELAKFYYNKADKIIDFPQTEIKSLYHKKALDICNSTAEKFPDAISIDNLMYIRDKILLSEVKLTLEKVNLPNKQFLGLIDYSNISQLFFRVYPVNIDEVRQMYSKNRSFTYDKKTLTKILKTEPFEKWKVELPDSDDLVNHSVEAEFPALDKGFYLILASTDQDFQISKKNDILQTFTTISDIACVHKSSLNNICLYVTNRDTGLPYPTVSVKNWSATYEKNSKTNILKVVNETSVKNDGTVLFDLNNEEYFNFVELEKGNDHLFVKLYNQKNKANSKQKNLKKQVYFFTDKKLYQPGQNISIKGLLIEQDEENSNEIISNQKVTIFITDSFGKPIYEEEVKTNKFGSFSLSFILPESIVKGRINIRSSFWGSQSVRVEEYKLPKFEVEIKPFEETYTINDTVNVSGIAISYSGYKINHAEVKFRVTRERYFPYFFSRMLPLMETIEIESDITQTNENGEFSFDFISLAQEDDQIDNNIYYNYRIYVDVTDKNGETVSHEKNIHIGSKSLILDIKLDEFVDKDKEHNIELVTNNLEGGHIGSKGNATIIKLSEPGRILKPRLWNKPDKFIISKDDFSQKYKYNIYDDEDDFTKWTRKEIVRSFDFDTNTDRYIHLDNMDHWKSGKYVIEIQSKDSKGKDVSSKKYFTLFSEQEKRIPYPVQELFIPIKTTCEPNEHAKFLIGSSDHDVRVIMNAENKGEIVLSEVFYLNNDQKLIEIPIIEDYRGGLNVSFVFVKHNRVYKHIYRVDVPWTNKQLSIKFDTFRDKLQPGQKEKWNIKIKDFKNQSEDTELLLTMYDAALDSFIESKWYINIWRKNRNRLFWITDQNFSSKSSLLYSMKQYKLRNKYFRRYDTLNYFGLTQYSTSYFGRRGIDGFHLMDGMALVPETVESDALVTPINMGGNNIDDLPDNEHLNYKIKMDKKLDVRKKLVETAFFEPHLKTNKKGEITYSFTAPDVLTTWKVRGLAFTKDLKTGFFQKELITQKELMVTPNNPRFFRTGDVIQYTTKLSNITDNSLSGQIILELLDVENENLINHEFQLENESMYFLVDAQGSEVFKWSLTIPENITAVKVRVKAISENHSDGEESIIPILSDKILITETKSLPINANESKQFVFNNLLSSKEDLSKQNHKLTLEYTSNPNWYAVQALPYLMEYPYDCNEQIFSRYYANSIALNIVNSNPEIKEVFEKWKKDSNLTTFLSKLNQNEELKSIILQETPWVNDATNEEENRRKLSKLFDNDKAESELNKALTKLKENQFQDGAWPWFAGMKANRYITQHIVAGFGHLSDLEIESFYLKENYSEMLKNAINYIDTQIYQDFHNLKKNGIKLNQKNISPIHIQYLYARSFFPEHQINIEYQEAFEYYRFQAKKYWLDFPIYNKTMIALSAFHFGDKGTAKNIIKSIKEFSLYDEEQGMYWRSNNRAFNWYEAPIETHAMLIEAFYKIEQDMDSVGKIQAWLLKNKQVNNWETTKSTTEAIYSLLMIGENKLSTIPVEIKLGNEKIDFENKKNKLEAGTGYFKKSWKADGFIPEMGEISVTNPNSSPAWGAVYWQYFDKMSNIETSGENIIIKKKLFVEKIIDKEITHELLTDSSSVEIGDRIIIRLEITSDRDMEYVHIKDLRASSFEPLNVFSGYKWKNGIGYYQSTGHTNMNFFIDLLPKGKHLLEYSLRVTNSGQFTNGIATIQCMYAPEFSAHSENINIMVE